MRLILKWLQGVGESILKGDACSARKSNGACRVSAFRLILPFCTDVQLCAVIDRLLAASCAAKLDSIKVTYAT